MVALLTTSLELLCSLNFRHSSAQGTQKPKAASWSVISATAGANLLTLSGSWAAKLHKTAEMVENGGGKGFIDTYIIYPITGIETTRVRRPTWIPQTALM